MAEQTAQPEVDLYDLSDEDFLKSFEAAKTAGKTEEPAEDGQPRDEQGRFVAKEPKTSTTEEPKTDAEPAPETAYEYEIDLGDGSGKQVFRGASYEDLIEKLGKAQEHATRKIRELTAAQKTVETKTVEPAVSEDEDWLLSQELMTTPSKAFPKLFEKLVGKPVDAFKTDLQRLDAFERAQREQANAKEFMETHPDYVANKHNGGLMERYLQTYKLEGTPENIKKAFTELSQGGLLQLKTAETTEVPEATDETPTKQRIAAPAGVRTVIVQKKAASGLSAKRSVSTPTEPTIEDMYAMSEDEFLKLGGMSKSENW